eukprot:5727505-Pyramimonas_sp.AAC.1
MSHSCCWWTWWLGSLPRSDSYLRYNSTPTSHYRYANVTLTSHLRHANVTLTSHQRHTNVTLMSHSYCWWTWWLGSLPRSASYLHLLTAIPTSFSGKRRCPPSRWPRAGTTT